MARYRVNDRIDVWVAHLDTVRVYLDTSSYSGRFSQYDMTPLEARDLAHWILANVPEEPERDREADMEALAKGVIQRLAYTKKEYGPNIAIYGDYTGIWLDFVLQVIGMPFDVPGEFHNKHSDKQYEYAKSLWNDLIPWMKKQYGGA